MKNPRVKKLTLDLDELEVESFEPSPSRQDQRGTVRAHSGDEVTCYQLTDHQSCHGTCDYSCYGSCGYSCYTCYDISCNGHTCVCWTRLPYCPEDAVM